MKKLITNDRSVSVRVRVSAVRDLNARVLYDIISKLGLLTI